MPGGEPAAARRQGDQTQADHLLLAVAGGDRPAFETFYDLVAPSVYGLVLSIVRIPARAQEIAQEVFLEAWANAARFDPERGSAKAWILTISRRRAVDHVRATQTTAEREALVAAREPRDYDTVVSAVETRLEHQQVRRCLHGLTQLQRQAVVLSFYEGYTQQEVSKLLSVPLGTIKSRLRDGLIRLRDCLGM